MKKKSLTLKVFSERSIFTHLYELRLRLIYSTLAWIGLAILFYAYSDNIVTFMTQPLSAVLRQASSPNHTAMRLIYTGLSEAFTTHIKIALTASLLFCLPLWFYQIWRFVSPALHEEEQKVLKKVFICAPFLFYAGVALAYYVVCPMAWRFFIGFQNFSTALPVQLEARLSEYIGLMIKLLMAFGFGFQLPLFVFLCVFWGFIPLSFLKKTRKYAFLGLTIIAAIITPPDILSPLALIIPVYAIYECLLWYLSFLDKKN